MKYLTDTEILSWNRRLEGSNISVYPLSNNRSSEPDICYKQKTSPSAYSQSETFVSMPEPHIHFNFIFSISSNRETEFFQIFEKLKKNKFGTKSIYTNNTATGSQVKVTDITFSDSIIEDKQSQKHFVRDKEYVRWTYNFSGKLGSIMAYVSYLEDTIEFLSKIWGYTYEGGEVFLMKFPIGSITSLYTDKSKDYLIIDYNYTKIGQNYYVDYIASEMLTNNTTITYGPYSTFKESELTFSRNERINDILN